MFSDATAEEGECGTGPNVVDGGSREVIVSWVCAEYPLAMEWVIGLDLDAAPSVTPHSLLNPPRWYIDVPRDMHAPAITLESGIQRLRECTEIVTLGQRRSAEGAIDFEDVAKADLCGITPPSCAELRFYMSWQIVQPYPVQDGVKLEVFASSQGREVDSARGASGRIRSACAHVEMRNVTDGEVYPGNITVAVRYVFGSQSS